ncbi:MAG: SpoIIE family protein phosphatase [Verrucomicrobia bacterium]|nr:SpoIIE family protein phosphatase [Verrucomicrobiota bacterium]
MKILIAEDDNVSRLVLVSALKKQGHEVVATENGLEALQVLQREYFPVLILDWLMPGMNGLEVCREVRSLLLERYTYIVLLTSLEGKSNYLEAMDAGADDFISKPFDADQLRGRIHVAERIINLQLRIAEGARELREKNEQMEKDLEMAHELQMALLPQQFPSIPRDAPATESAIKFSSFYYPMAAVSGDFFTVNRLSDTALAVFIADVMGHGVRAGLITTMISALIEKFSAAAADPAVMLSKINCSLLSILKNTDRSLFVTGFYLVADAARSRILYANAGHPAPLLLHRVRGEIESISSDGGSGPALGLFDEAKYRTCECPMAVDDFIMLFTDGLFEVEAADDKIYSRERLIAAVRERVRLPSAKMIAELFGEIKLFSNRAQFSDDVCLVGMDVTRLCED